MRALWMTNQRRTEPLEVAVEGDQRLAQRKHVGKIVLERGAAS